MAVNPLKKGTFLWSRWDSNPRTTETCIKSPKALPTELRLLWIKKTHPQTGFFLTNSFINNYVDDTDYNTLGTISFLDLQSIVEGVDRLDGHCLHNHDWKSHLKSLARCVNGLWLSSTTTRNRHNSC